MILLELLLVLKVFRIFDFSFFYLIYLCRGSSKDEQKLQEAQTLNIHVVSEEFLNDVKTDRPTVVMEKCKISTWGILPHIRQQKKVDDEAKVKSGRQSFTTLSENLIVKFQRKEFNLILSFFSARINKSVQTK